MNAVIGYPPSPERELRARCSLAGGAPYTPFILQASQAINRGIADANRINGKRYPTYHNLNLRADRRFVFKGSVLTSYPAIWNAYGRDNISDHSWSEVDMKPDAYQQWGPLPLIGFEWRF